MDILTGLNPAQREAVEAIQGPVLVIAGPGSGKTRVIAHRIAYLIKVCGLSPHRILAVTFTNKAAREMKERICRILNQAADGLTLGTFHAICAHILRREAKHADLEQKFVIYDEDDQLSLVNQILQEMGLDPKEYPPRAIKSAISSAKARLLGPQEYKSQSYFEEIVKRVYERYQKLLAESNALDFDDLLMKVVRLFRKRTDILSRYQSRFVHVMIDEFQDTNLAQYVLAKLLAGKYQNIFAVGDPDQSIYSWRFADMRHILNFERDYPNAKVLFLEQNYRSSRIILEAAAHLISANKQRREKNLWTENEVGVPINIVETYDEQEEAQFVVSEVERLITEEGQEASDCAVMYRTNAQSRALEEAFIRYGLPYKLVGATKFYERREIKDVLSYLRLIHNPYDSVSLNRIINVPGRGIGQHTMIKLLSCAQSKGVPLYQALKFIANGGETSLPSRSIQALERFANLIDELIAESERLDLVSLFDLTLERTGYKNYILGSDNGEERWSNILELRGIASEYKDLEPREGLASFLERVSLVSDVDNFDERVNAVTLITLHQAKGLEFPVVFIVGMDEGVLPHFKSFADPEQMEEERRLCYVGITRAKSRVYLVHAFRRSLMGGSKPSPPSRFLQDIPPNLVASRKGQQIGGNKPGFADFSSPRIANLKIGDRVRHAKFGEGIVVNCLPIKDDYEVTVAFRQSVGVKRLLLSLAPMEKI